MQDIKVNLLLDMVIDNEYYPEHYPVRVEDVADQYVYLSIPTKKGRLIRFEAGQEVKCVFKNLLRYYGFVGTVVEVKTNPIPILKIQMPTSFMSFPQRRHHVRLPVTLPVRFRPLAEAAGGEEDQEWEHYDGQTINISAGGILFCTNIQLDIEQKIDIEFAIPEQDVLNCTAHVLRIADIPAGQSRNQWIAIQYQDILPGEQDKIFKFIFKKERELIQNGIHP